MFSERDIGTDVAAVESDIEFERHDMRFNEGDQLELMRVDDSPDTEGNIQRRFLLGTDVQNAFWISEDELNESEVISIMTA